MKSIVLPAITKHVQFGELAQLIADALWPDAGPDDDRMTYAFARINLDDELARAVDSGALPVKDPLTLGPHTYPVGNALETALVTVNDLQRFVSDRGLSVIVGTQEPEAVDAPAAKDNDVFRLMPNLTADELNIAFVGDKPEPNSDIGANNFLEISARGETRRIALAALNLVNKQSGGLNRMGAILLGFAKNFDPPDSGANVKTISRLRQLIKTHLGIKSDPFDPKAAKWKPRFKIVDKRGAADERAKREAERNTISYELMNERSERADDIEEHPYDDEGDTADEWLKNNSQA